MKPRLHLLHLEKQVPESVFRTGERYHEEGRVSHLRQIDTGLWQANVHIEQDYEPEILLRGNRVQAWSCDCTPGRKKTLCAHIVATLLMLRTFLEQQKAKRAGVTTRDLRLEIKELLPHIPPEELAAFLRAELKLSPELSLALKTRFYHHLHTSKAADFRELLFTPYQDEAGVLITDDPSIAPQLRLMVRQLLLQSDQYLKNGEDEAALDNVRYLLTKLDRSPRTRLKEQLIRRLTTWVIEECDLPVTGAGDARYRFLLELLPQLHRMDQSEALQAVLLEVQGYAGFEEARLSALPVLRDAINRTTQASPSLLPLLLVYYQNLPTPLRTGGWLKHLHLPRISPQTYEDLGTALSEIGDFEDALHIVEEGREQYPAHIPLQRLRRKLLWELHDFDELEHQCLDLLAVTLEVSDFQAAISLLPEERLAPLLKKLADLLEAAPESFRRFTLSCTLARHREDWGRLAVELERSGSRKLLLQHAPALYAAEPGLAANMISAFMRDYLSKHIGPPSHDTLGALSTLCREHNMSGVRAALAAMLKKDFPERDHLQSLI